MLSSGFFFFLHFNDVCLDLVTDRILDRDPKEEVLKAFKLFDDDESGKISLRNLRRVARELGENVTDEELRSMINEFDTDGDGESEFQSLFFCLFSHFSYLAIIYPERTKTWTMFVMGLCMFSWIGITIRRNMLTLCFIIHAVSQEEFLSIMTGDSLWRVTEHRVGNGMVSLDWNY